MLLKITFSQHFFVLFDSLKTTDIFIPSMKFSLNYHQQYEKNFIKNSVYNTKYSNQI